MGGPFNALARIVSVSFVGLRTIPQRIGPSVSAVVGVALVVLVLTGVLSIAQGIVGMIEKSSDPESVIVLRGGSSSEMTSVVMGPDVDVIAERTELARGSTGPLVSPELFVILNLPKRSTGTDANVPLRGVTPTAFEIRDLELVEGRRFRPGLTEAIVGVGAAREFAGLELGGVVPVGSEEWDIVGIFEAEGGMAEVEVWADAAVVRDTYNRGDSYQAVYAKLERADRFRDFKDALNADPRLDVETVLEEEFFLGQSVTIRAAIVFLGTLVAVIMGLGVSFAALNTMYAAVSSRTREIATLRALGFSRIPVIVSVMVESVALAAAGGLIGGMVAYLVFDGLKAATINFQSFSQIAFEFAVTPRLLAVGIGLAVLLGFFGGLLPAIRAARLPIATALREN